MNALVAISTPVGKIKNKKGKERLRPITIQWHRCRMGITAPLGYNVAEIYWDGDEIDNARNEVVKLALKRNYKYLFFLDDDVLVPGSILRKLVYHADNNLEFYVFSGVYTLKRHPAEPLLWHNGYGNGITWDWKVGDILKDITGIGMGCALIRLSLFEKLSEPWFQWIHDIIPNEIGGELNHNVGEDLYFCKKLVEETGTKIFVDTNMLCAHIDNSTGEIFKLPKDSYPFKE